jgi:hypothetical protein
VILGVDPLRRARIAACLLFLLYGTILGAWTARIPAIKLVDGLALVPPAYAPDLATLALSLYAFGVVHGIFVGCPSNPSRSVATGRPTRAAWSTAGSKAAGPSTPTTVNHWQAVRLRGPEISAERLCELLEPFRRGQRDRLHSSGVGLGLAISSSAAAAHGASLTLLPQRSGGVRVVVAFSGSS